MSGFLTTPSQQEGTNRGFSVFGFEVDWWAYGVVAYEMLCGNLPFSDDTVAGTYNRIMSYQVALAPYQTLTCIGCAFVS